MLRLTIVTTLGFLAAVGVAVGAWSVGSAEAAGITAGYSLGAALSLVGLAWQRRVRATDAHRAMAVFAGAFLGKLFFLVVAGIVLTRVPALAELIDGRTFVLGFAGGVVLVQTWNGLEGLLANAALPAATAAASNNQRMTRAQARGR